MTKVEGRYAYERQLELLKWLEQAGRISTEQICALFNVSPATARRDLQSLARQGKIQRVHGGAISVHRTAPEAPMLLRIREQEKEKACIGRTAAELVQDGETVFLGSGTTVLQVARNLLHKNLTVITNSLPVINLMAGKENINLIALGGNLRGSELSFIGHITEQALAEVRADKVIISVRALSLEHGLTNDYLPETLTDRAILKIGREIILTIDHTKCEAVSTAFLAPLSAIHTVVTDSKTDTNFIAALRAKGIKVIVAKMETCA